MIKSAFTTPSLIQRARAFMDKLEFIEPTYIQRILPPGEGLVFSEGSLGLKREFLDRFNSEVGVFDYMGSSQFEYGAVPRALALIHERSQKHPFVTAEIQVDCIADEYEKREYDLPEKKSVTVYIIAPEDFMDSIVEFIESEAKGGNSRLCERSMFREAVFSEEIQNKGGSAWEARGWLDLQNSYFFFIDKKMFKDLKRFWGVPDSPTPPEDRPEPLA